MPMTPAIGLIFWAVFTILCIFIYQKCSSYCAFRIAYTRHSCRQPPTYPHRDKIWGVGPTRGKAGEPFTGRGVFSHDGAIWKHSRELIKPTFTKQEISDLDVLETYYFDQLLCLIPRDGTTIDMQPLLHRFVR